MVDLKDLKLSEQMRWILCWLTPGAYESPTHLGQAYRRDAHSSWASPKLIRLEKMGLTQRDNRGFWTLTHDGIYARRQLLLAAPSLAKDAPTCTWGFRAMRWPLVECKRYQPTKAMYDPEWDYCPYCGRRITPKEQA